MKPKAKMTVPQLLSKLDELYDKEEALSKEIKRLMLLFNQLKEDKELLQNMIMYQSNKLNRMRQAKW